jgi:hypothetical protein
MFLLAATNCKQFDKKYEISEFGAAQKKTNLVDLEK